MPFRTNSVLIHNINQREKFAESCNSALAAGQTLLCVAFAKLDHTVNPGFEWFTVDYSNCRGAQKDIFENLTSLAQLSSAFDLGSVITGNRMAGVPLGRSLGDGEPDVEGICAQSGMVCQNCTLAVPQESCGVGLTCNAHLGSCTDQHVPECDPAASQFEHTCEQTGVLPAGPNHYFVCLMKNGHLHPQVFICPHGWFFVDGFCRPEPGIAVAIEPTEAVAEKESTPLPDVYWRMSSLFSTDQPTTYKADTFLADKFNLTNYETADDGEQREIGNLGHRMSQNCKSTFTAATTRDANNNTLFVIRTREKENEVISPEVNLTKTEKKDIMEAAEYGMQKMHELYAVMEPKLYSMGLWLDDSNPARYVAAFNAPSEDAAKFYRYGYASLQAAAKLKQLTSRDGLESRTEEAQFPAASALRQSPLLQHCPLRGTPKCPPASKRYRTHDGTCNNLNRPRWGSTMTPVQRFLAPSYSDGIQAPRRSVFGSPLPSAREISSMVHEDQHVETPGITHLLMQWGQFLDHDHPECMPIAVPQSDPFYGPKGVRCLDFVRSSPAPRDDCALGWREQMNQVSAYIDGSPLYASSARQSDKLRLFRNGMLQYGKVQNRRPLLPPERRDELCRGGAVSSDCFKSGDARVNEHPGLVAAHIVWLRQHNRMAQELAHLNPHWSDEKVYQETRKIVGAMIQHITYREFLPIVLGQEVMRLFDLEPQKKGYYTGYSPKINPSPASSFGSAAFRFGHSLVQPSMVRFDRFHRPMKNNVSLHDELTNPSNIWSMGAVDRLLLGMVNQPIQKRDEFITEELTNHLFQTPSYENGGFESSLTPAQLQQIRRISFAQILCRTLDTIDSIQPFVFLSAENIDNDRISCLNGLLNNFDLSPWTDVNSSNDISKSDDISTQAPNETKTTTTKKPTTKKPQKLAANKVGQKKPAPANTYDDTYRRPNKPYYYNRQNDKNENYNLRQNRPNLNDETFSSARSNEQTMTTTKSEATIDKNDVTDNNKPTTENLYKLVTFGYVGTYKGDMANFKETKTDPTHQTIKHDFISKDFSTYEDEKVDKAEKQEFTKLSTFFHYDTATKPYNNVRPTRRNDDDLVPDYTKTNSKYYFVRNVLRKYPDDNSTVTDKTDDATEIKDILKENYNGPGQPLPVTIEERASGDKLALLEEAEAKSANPEPSKLRLKITKPSSPAKTPTVAFQVMPSENNPSQWATYDEKDLPEGLPHRMPPIKTDPYALKEIPRPFNFANLRKRIPGRTRN
ncbi:hypothetical protein MSG28_003849 [Choristoneura fumiferana]|uniref:Uncharacterized protein n=1 Tax=Choristoneura fumiferana TaxID=7141 RepID=A0ACC0KGT4_CHOFU|nr:hypothetical protein MSG28_003849 [Choristoneura fumiferana]